MKDWEAEIWDECPPDPDEPAMLERGLPGSVSKDGTKRHCTDFHSIKVVARFYAEISQKPVDVHRDDAGWWCLRVELPPTSTEMLIAAERRRHDAERAEQARRKNELAKLPAERDLPGKYSKDRSLFKCETREAADLAAKFFALRSGKSVHIWPDDSGWAVETHNPSPLTLEAERAKNALAEQNRILSGNLTDEEWSEREAQRERERINENWRENRPSPSWSTFGVQKQ